MWEALKSRNFRLFLGGQIVSFTGNWMQLTARGWLVYRLTHDPFQLGLVGLLIRVPMFLLGTFGGAVADRVDRRRLIMVTKSLAMAQSLVLAVLTLTGRIELWHIYLLCLAAGAINAFDFPARQVLIGDLVPQSQRHKAIALGSGAVNVSRVVGPVLAGLIVAAAGEGPCFLINAFGFLAVLAALAAMGEVSGSAGKPRAGAWSETVEGWRYALGNDAVRMLLAGLAVGALAGMPYTVLMPVFAEDVLSSGSAGLGVLMGASGVGATAGALWLAARKGTGGLPRLVVLTTMLFGLTLILFAASRAFWVSCLLLVLVGTAMVVTLAGINTLLQELAPPRVRGRIMGLYVMTLMGGLPLGSFLAGMLAGRIGAPWTVALGGGLLVMVGLLLWGLPGRVEARRRAKGPDELMPPPVGGRPLLEG